MKNIHEAHSALRPALHPRSIEHPRVPQTRTDRILVSGTETARVAEPYIPARRGILSDRETAIQEQNAAVHAPIRFMANCIYATRIKSGWPSARVEYH